MIVDRSPTPEAAKSRKENPQTLTQLSPRFHPRHLAGIRTALKDAIKDITSDSQVNSYFPYRWSPASLTINIYFYLFLYLYITRITINNGTPHLKSLKSQNRRAALGWPAKPTLITESVVSISSATLAPRRYFLYIEALKSRSFSRRNLASATC